MYDVRFLLERHSNHLYSLFRELPACDLAARRALPVFATAHAAASSTPHHLEDAIAKAIEAMRPRTLPLPEGRRETWMSLEVPDWHIRCYGFTAFTLLDTAWGALAAGFPSVAASALGELKRVLDEEPTFLTFVGDIFVGRTGDLLAWADTQAEPVVEFLAWLKSQDVPGPGGSMIGAADVKRHLDSRLRIKTALEPAQTDGEVIERFVSEAEKWAAVGNIRSLSDPVCDDRVQMFRENSWVSYSPAIARKNPDAFESGAVSADSAARLTLAAATLLEPAGRLNLSALRRY